MSWGVEQYTADSKRGDVERVHSSFHSHCYPFPSSYKPILLAQIHVHLSSVMLTSGKTQLYICPNNWKFWSNYYSAHITWNHSISIWFLTLILSYFQQLPMDYYKLFAVTLWLNSSSSGISTIFQLLIIVPCQSFEGPTVNLFRKVYSARNI